MASQTRFTRQAQAVSVCIGQIQISTSTEVFVVSSISSNIGSSRRAPMTSTDPDAAGQGNLAQQAEPGGTNQASAPAAPASETRSQTDLRNLPGAHQSCTYTQSTGNLTCHDADGRETINHDGYSGRNVQGGVQGRNNPEAQCESNTGPLPRGHYVLAAPQDRPGRTGPVSIQLIPDAANDMCQRSDFWIHGDNPQHDASNGCIILPRSVRELLNAGDRLEVIR